MTVKLTPAQQQVVDAINNGIEVRVTKFGKSEYYTIGGESANGRAIKALADKDIIRADYFTGKYRVVA